MQIVAANSSSPPGNNFSSSTNNLRTTPKRCKPCKSKRSGVRAKAGTGPAAAGLSRTETRTECSECGIETTVPFKPTQGRPVLCRQCFQSKRVPTTGALVTAAATAEMVASKTGDPAAVGMEMLAAAQIP